MKLPTSFFLCLIGMLSLSACAQPLPTETAKPAEQKTLVTELEPIANEPIPAKTNSGNKDMTSMIDLDNPPRGPAIPAIALKQQILALIASLQSRDDTNQANVEKHLKVKMHVDPEWDRNRMYWGQTTEGWKYWLSVTSVRNEPASTIEFYFFHGEEVPDDALPKTCTLDSETLSKDIEALGFKRSDELFRIKGRRWWGFRKNVPMHNATFGIEVHVYQVENGTENGLLCVKQIGIGTDPIHE